MAIPPNKDNISITGSPQGGALKEWVQLRNVGSEPVELLGAKIRVPNAQKLVSNLGKHIFTFTVSTILAPGESVKIYSLVAAGSTTPSFNTELPLFYEQGKDVVEFVDANGTVIEKANINNPAKPEPWVVSTLLPGGGGVHDFGGQQQGAGAKQATFTIENRGPEPFVLLGPAAVTLTSGAGSFTIKSQPSSPVAPGGKVEFVVSFEATTVGQNLGTLEIQISDLGAPIVVSLRANTLAKPAPPPAPVPKPTPKPTPTLVSIPTISLTHGQSLTTPAMDLHAIDFTIATKIKVASNSHQNVIIGNWGPGSWQLLFTVQASGKLYVALRKDMPTGGSDPQQDLLLMEASTRFGAGSWHHVAVTFTWGSSRKAPCCTLYLDGQSVGQALPPITPNPKVRNYYQLMPSHHPYLIGRKQDSNNANSHFTGEMKDFRVYGEALQAPAIQVLAAT